MADSGHEIDKLLESLDRTQQAVKAHVRLVMTIGSADRPLEMPARSADNEWWAAYRILRAEQEEAQDALEEYLRRRNAPSRKTIF